MCTLSKKSACDTWVVLIVKCAKELYTLFILIKNMVYIGRNTQKIWIKVINEIARITMFRWIARMLIIFEITIINYEVKVKIIKK